MYIQDILNILPPNSPFNHHLHVILNYIKSFDIQYIVFDSDVKNPLAVPMKKIKYLIYQKYIDSLQSSTEYSDEYYLDYQNAMHVFHLMYDTMNCIDDDYLLSVLLQRVPPRRQRTTINDTVSYIATYQ